LEAAIRRDATEDAKRLTQLEKEKAGLKKLLAEVELEKPILKDLAEGNF